MITMNDNEWTIPNNTTKTQWENILLTLNKTAAHTCRTGSPWSSPSCSPLWSTEDGKKQLQRGTLSYNPNFASTVYRYTDWPVEPEEEGWSPFSWTLSHCSLYMPVDTHTHTHTHTHKKLHPKHTPRTHNPESAALLRTFFCRLLTRSKARLARYSPYTWGTQRESSSEILSSQYIHSFNNNNNSNTTSCNTML